MKHFTVLLFAFLLFSNSSFAQCDLSISPITNYCIIEDNNQDAVIALSADVPPFNPINWTVTGGNYVNEDVLNNEYYVYFDTPGNYKISMKSGTCEQSMDFNVDFPAEIQTSLVEDYTLCDEELTIEFQVLNADEFDSFMWSGSSLIPAISETSSVFSRSFNRPEQFNLILETTDSNSCITLKEFNINIKEGPILNDIKLTSTIGDDQCLIPESEFVLEFQPIVSMQNILDYSFYPEDTTILVGTDYLEKQISVPVVVNFDDGCAIESTIEHTHHVNHNVFFEANFNEVLCSNDRVNLEIKSPHKNHNGNDFRWNLVGPNFEESYFQKSINFMAPEDGNYDITLDYERVCPSEFSKNLLIDVDYISPEASGDLSVFSCDLETSISFNNESQLESGITYQYNWELIPSDLNDISDNLSSSEESPTFTVKSTSAQSYDLKLTVASNSCSEQKQYEDVLILGGVTVDVNPGPTNICDNGSIITNSIIQSDKEAIYDYKWEVFKNGTQIHSSNKYFDSFYFDELGTYEIKLNVQGQDCSYDAIHDVIVYPSPKISNIFSDTYFCNTPLDTVFRGVESPPSSGNNIYSWKAIDSSFNTVESHIGLNYTPGIDKNDVYSFEYSITNDISNCKTSDDFKVYVGVDANLFLPEYVCFGKPFEISAETSIGIGDNSQFIWSSNSDNLSISNSNNSSALIDVNNGFSVNQIEEYDLEFSVTNDFGCEVSKSGSVKSYTLDAKFETAKEDTICARELNTFTSINNDFVNNFVWSY